VLTNLEKGGCVVLWRGEEERWHRALARGGRRRRAPAQVLARTLRPPWPPAQSSPVRQGHSPAQSMAVHHSFAPPPPPRMRTRASLTGRRWRRRESNRAVKMNRSKGRLRRAAEEPARGGVLETAVTAADDVRCSEGASTTLPAQMSSSVSDSTASMRVVADSTAPLCPVRGGCRRALPRVG
jgi:hypothetical protein